MAAIADVAAELDGFMKARGGRMVMMLPPNGHTVNSEMLPAYARALKRSPTEYDLVMQAVRDKGVTFVDMRPFLRPRRRMARCIASSTRTGMCGRCPGLQCGDGGGRPTGLRVPAFGNHR